MSRAIRAAFLALALCAAAGTALRAQQECTTPESMRARLAGTPDAATFEDLGIALADQKLYACAAMAFADSLRLKPDSANVLFMLGTSLFFSGHAPEAVGPLQASEGIDSRNLKLHLILASLFDRLHRGADAKAEWQAAVATDPLSPEAVDGLAQELVLNQEYQASVDLLASPQSARQRTAQQSLNLGIAYAALGNTDAAIDALRDGLNTTPDSLAIAGELADMLAQAGRVDEADAVFALALERHPGDLDTGLHRFRMLLAADPSRAKNAGQDLLRTAPQNWEVLYLNGVLETQTGELDRARTHLDASIAVNDGFPLSHSLLGVVLARQHDYVGARLQFERAIALGDTSEEVRDNLARVTQALQP
jgi:tetratricopeptide (TPR) repeat protein